MFLNKLISFDFPDKNDLTVYFISNYDLGSTTYDGTDLKMSSAHFWRYYLDVKIDVSDDYIFLSDYIDMFQVTKNSNYSIETMWSTMYYIYDIKIYDDMGKFHRKSFNVYLKISLLSNH